VEFCGIILAEETETLGWKRALAPLCLLRMHSKRTTLRWKPCLCGYEQANHHVKYDVGVSMSGTSPYLTLCLKDMITEHRLIFPLLFLSKFQSE